MLQIGKGVREALYRTFSLTRPAAMKIYCEKKKRFYTSVQLDNEWTFSATAILNSIVSNSTNLSTERPIIAIWYNRIWNKIHLY